MEWGLRWTDARSPGVTHAARRRREAARALSCGSTRPPDPCRPPLLLSSLTLSSDPPVPHSRSSTTAPRCGRPRPPGPAPFGTTPACHCELHFFFWRAKGGGATGGAPLAHPLAPLTSHDLSRTSHSHSLPLPLPSQLKEGAPACLRAEVRLPPARPSVLGGLLGGGRPAVVGSGEVSMERAVSSGFDGVALVLRSRVRFFGGRKGMWRGWRLCVCV